MLQVHLKDQRTSQEFQNDHHDCINFTFFNKEWIGTCLNQIQVCLADISKIAFCAHDGHYEFLVMCFGLSNLSGTFQNLMNEIFLPSLRMFVLVFFDDVIVYSTSLQELAHHVSIVLKCLHQHQHYVKLSKCDLINLLLNLGHILYIFGILVNPKKKLMHAWMAKAYHNQSLEGILRFDEVLQKICTQLW